MKSKIEQLLRKWGMVVLRWDGELTVVLPHGIYDAFGWKLDITVDDIPNDVEVVSSNLIHAEREKYFGECVENAIHESRFKVSLL